MIRTPSAAAIRARARAARWHRRSRSLGARDDSLSGRHSLSSADVRGLAGYGRSHAEKQNTAGKKARAAARAGEKYTAALSWAADTEYRHRP